MAERESVEKLEQLRLLENSDTIHVHPSDNPVAIDINTPEHYAFACRIFDTKLAETEEAKEAGTKPVSPRFYMNPSF